MRVGIDATSVLLRSAGVKNYTFHWINHLRALAGPDAIRVFPYLDRWGSLDHQHSLIGPLATALRLALVAFLRLPGNKLIDAATAGLDVFHASNQMRNKPRRVRVTATVHDMTCWLTPELHTPANVRADTTFARTMLQHADGLIAVSENTRQDAIRILDLDPARIRVIYPGVPEAYFQAAQPRPDSRGSVDKPYILYVGTIEPRKNVETLLDAYGGLPEDLRNAFDLVLIGPIGWGAETTAARLRSGAPGIRYLGYVPEPELPGLTAGAALFVYPSLYEGFGFPVAQAMAAGAPVLTSDVSSLPEITGDAAVLVDPKSAHEIRGAMERLLGDPEWRARLGQCGKARAQRYRWEQCASESLDFFRTVAGR